MVTIIGIKNCNKMKKTFTWMEENDIPYTFRDIKKQPLEEQELAEITYKLGLDVVINKRGMMWKKLGLAQKNLSEDELFDVLLEHQNMMNRPLISYEEGAFLIGYDEDSFEGAFIE